MPSLDQIGDAHHVAGGLRDLLTRLAQMPAVHPDGHDLVADRALGLGDLVFVMGEAQIVATGVDVEALAQVLHGHRRALDVPAREALAPRAGPFHQPARSRRLPQGEVRGVALAGVGLQIAVALAEVVKVLPESLP